MILVGLTGNMASGKSTVLSMFKELGAVTISADQLVHLLQQKDTEQTKALAHLLGDEILAEDGSVNRAELSNRIIKDPSIIKILEQLFYPSIKVMMKKLIKTAEEVNQKIVVLEVPLLFETDFAQLVDTNVVCSGGEESRKRVLERPGMTEEKLNILNRFRLKDSDLQKLAKNIVNTDVDLEKTKMQVTLVYSDLLTMAGNVWPANWSNIEDMD